MASPVVLDPVLVIGGCGGLGFHIVQQLLESREATSITVLDINTERNRIDGARYVRGSVSSRDDVSKVLADANPRVIFHVASPHLMHQSAAPELFEEVNVSGTRNLLDCIYENGAPKVLVYTSSTGIIHNGYTDIIKATEDVPICFFPEQTEFYAHTKGLAEVMIREANRVHGLLTVALRCTTLYGEGDNTTIPQMVGNAQSGRGKMQVGDGQNMFDFTYLGNAAYAHRLAAKKLIELDPNSAPLSHKEQDDSMRVDGEAFLITNDEPWKFWDFVRAVGTAAGCGVRKENVRVIPTWIYYTIAVIAEWTTWLFTFGRRESQINRKMIRFFSMTNTFDISKAKTRLGYKPQTSTQQGIDKAVHAYIQTASTTKKNV